MDRPGGKISGKAFVRELKEEYKRDNLKDHAAALTYYGVLALFPFLLFLVTLAGIVVRPEQIEALVAQLATVAPGEAVGLIEQQLDSLVRSAGGGLLTVGLLGALWAASNGIAAMMRALNVAWDVEEDRPYWKVRLIAIAATLFAAVFFVGAALIAVAAPAVAGALGGPLATAITWLRLPVAGLLMVGLIAVLYWALPAAPQRFRLVSPGAVAAVAIWLVASWGFSLYVRNFGSYDATYGALGGVIVLLLWMWISAQALLLGAEINAILERRAGMRPERRRPETIGRAGPERRRRVEEERRPPATTTPEPPRTYH